MGEGWISLNDEEMLTTVTVNFAGDEIGKDVEQITSTDISNSEVTTMRTTKEILETTVMTEIENPDILLGSFESSGGSKDEIVNTDDLLDLNIETEVTTKLVPTPKTLQDTWIYH